MVRDDELNRLIKYAQGMGLSVHFKPSVKGSTFGAEYVTDGTEVIIYITKRTTKLDKIFSLIHELSHHKAYINNDREIDEKLDEILIKEDPKKRERYEIWKSEIRDAQYWEEIYRDTNCQFNINRLYAQKDFDLWVYEFYYENGGWPTWKLKNNKIKELIKKYKNGKRPLK